MAINAPGNMHDSKIADYGEIYTKLRKLFDQFGVEVVVDSAFLAKNAPFIIKTSANVTNRTRQQIRNAPE